MVIKQFQNFTANKVLTNTRLLFVRALESRLKKPRFLDLGSLDWSHFPNVVQDKFASFRHLKSRLLTTDH